MNFSLRQIRYFVTTALAGQVNRAAIELCVSQSAVTSSIRQLEESLGLVLFIRGSTGVSLTQDGEQFLRHARDILATVEQAMQVRRRGHETTAGEVTVGVTYTVAGYFVMPLLARFRRIYPEVNITLTEGPRLGVERAVAEGSLDLAITPMQHSQHCDALARRTLHRSARRLWLSASSPLLEKPIVSLADVVEQPFIALTIDDAWEYAKQYWEQLPIQPTVIFRTSSVEAIRAMVAAGMGVSILSDMIYRSRSLDGHRIETRDLDFPVPSIDMGIVYPTHRALSAPARTFSNYLKRVCDAAAAGRTLRGL